jgi:hypothetical protein
LRGLFSKGRSMAAGSIVQGVRWIADAAGRIVGYRNPFIDKDEDLNAAAIQSAVTGGGIVGTFADTTALQAAFPAGTAGRRAMVGASAPYTEYTDNGTAWAAASGGGSPGGSTTQLQFNDAGAFAGVSGMTWDKTNNVLTIAGGAHTTSQPQTITETWNAGAVNFTAFRVNVTNIASGSASLLADFQVGGVSRFNVRKDGTLITAGSMGVAYGLSVDSAGSGSGLAFGLATDAVITRDNQDILAMRRTGQQTWRVYGTYTDASNGRWLESTMNTSGAGTMRPTGNGTGASGSTLMVVSGSVTVANLPASPGEGARHKVSDSTTTTFLAAVTGGGSNHVPVVYLNGAWCVG